MRHFGRLARARLLAGASAAVILAGAGAAQAEERTAINIAPQPLASALYQFGGQTGLQVMFAPSLAERKSTVGVNGETDVRLAMAHLLEGTGLTFRREGDIFVIMDANDPQSAGAAGDGADAGTVAALVVTAQKREENIQDVPIAISAFTEKSLQEQKIEGGFDLLKAIPNVSFSKNNFSGYNFSIRGIGTKAISVTTDPGVAVEFNSTPLIRNRLFEQEYFDIERVEVLRGPQGTLHGRNATAGVINVISAKPNMSEFNGWLKGEVGSYNTKRLSAMVNVPLVNDKLAIRFAGAATMRDGFTINLFDNTHDDGRNLWSARMTVGFNPTENIRTNLIWERFEEDDDRSRTSKQLCTPDPGPEKVGNRVITGSSMVFGGVNLYPLELQRGIYSQGCLPGSLYDDAAYGAPNGWAIPFIAALAQQMTGMLGLDSRYSTPFMFVPMSALKYGVNPYGGVTQSHDLRAIYSQLHPTYQAKTDVLEWNTEIDLGDQLTLTMQTGYVKDQIRSTQDYNRYTTVPAFNDSTLAVTTDANQSFIPSAFHDLMPGGVFCDPQLGCSNTIVGEDLSRARSEQFAQEARIASNFDGPVNFVLGGNFLRYRTVEDYYVFNNGITLAGVVSLTGGPLGTPSWYFGAPDRHTTNPDCTLNRPVGALLCVPIEQNPISDIQDVGHNYFLSRNPYVLASKSVFGEAYWAVAENLKVTAGLRYTDDKKRFTLIPSQTLLTPRDYIGLVQNPSPYMRDYMLSLPLTGTGFGYPVQGVETREWREVTGRLGLEWRPELQFADQTLIYAFYARGYKGGGFNPPRPGFNYEEAAAQGNVYAFSAPPEFAPEFVDSFEVGAKNTLLGGAATVNATAFFYDYKGYQISKIVDRSAYNENFDARVWGVELEGVFAPARNLRFNGSLGYLDTALGNGSKSIDVMNRTAGHTDWIVVKPAVTIPSNCIIPVRVAEVAGTYLEVGSSAACPGGGLLGGNWTGKPPYYITLFDGTTYDPADHPEAHYGFGFDTDVSGNELPNSPHFTVTLGAQYSFDFLENWRGTVRADGYWQSQSWARVYELPIDKLHGWYNANLSVWVERPDDGLKIEFYVKNLLDETPITDAFINSDDSALTTNVFTLDPRLIGLSIRKEF